MTSGSRRCSRRRQSWLCPSCFTSQTRMRFSCRSTNHNERYEELAAHPEWSFYGSHFGKQELLAAARPGVRAASPHDFCRRACGRACARIFPMSAVCSSDIPIFYVDIGARCAELGRQPYSAREFFHQATADRILFGTDLVPEVGHVSAALQISGDGGRVFRIPLARIAPGPVEYLWIVPAGRGAAARIPQQRASTVEARMLNFREVIPDCTDLSARSGRTHPDRSGSGRRLSLRELCRDQPAPRTEELQICLHRK